MRVQQAPRNKTTSTSTWLCEINSIVKSLLKIYTSGEGKSPKKISAAAKIAKKQFGAKKNFPRKFRIGNFCFANFARFRTTHGQTDGAISSRVKFCFRCAYSEVCTTKIPPHPVPYRPSAHVSHEVDVTTVQKSPTKWSP